MALVVPPRSEKELAELEEKPQEEIGEIKVVGEEKKAAEAEEALAQNAGASSQTSKIDSK